MIRAALAAAGLLVCVVAGSAQSTRSRVFVYAADRSGAPISDLTESDFDVKAGGERCAITSVRYGSAPMRVVVVLDDTDAAGPELGPVRRGLHLLADRMPQDAELALVTVAGGYALRLAPTTDRTRFLRSVDAVRAEIGGGGTHIAESLLRAGKQLFDDPRSRWPVFVIVTTNTSEDMTHVRQVDFDLFSEGLMASGATVHAVLLGGASNSQGGKILETMARNLAGNTGGLFREAEDPRSVPDALLAVARKIDADRVSGGTMYEIEYAGPPAGGRTEVNVGVSREGVALAPSLRRVP